jgi:hypothetical protein
MNSLPAGVTQSWFVVKVAVALSPILTFWAVGVIDWFLRRTLWPRSDVEPQSGGEPASDEPAGVQGEDALSRIVNRSGAR